jgi:glyoxylase-like metal-dependent hydrolase (beta-lactamase superfamily II)
MTITPLVVGDLRTNCYVASDEATGQCLIIDPADEADFISTTILEKKFTPTAIILTHGHYDHCLAALELKLNFNIPIYLHQADLFLYKNADKSAKFWSSSLRGGNPTRQSHTKIFRLPPIDLYLENNQTITFGDSHLDVIHTPGHTPGSVCLYCDPSLFTGDTVFADGVGRADHSYSSKSDLKKSLQTLAKLKDNSIIYPGHEEYDVPLRLPKYLRI